MKLRTLFALIASIAMLVAFTACSADQAQDEELIAEEITVEEVTTEEESENEQAADAVNSDGPGDCLLLQLRLQQELTQLPLLVITKIR